MELHLGINVEQSLQILSSKKFKKEVARSEGDEQLGGHGGMLRERRVKRRLQLFWQISAFRDECSVVSAFRNCN